MRNISIAILVFLATMLLGSCSEHKEIKCPAGNTRKIHITFMWDKAKDANPQGMTLYFYPANGLGKSWRFDISGRDGGDIEIPSGKYNLLTVNNDLPGISMIDESRYSEIAAAVRHFDTDTYARPTGTIYCGKVTDIEITPCSLSYRKEDGSIKECPAGLIRCYPDTLSTLYHITVSEIKNIQLARNVKISLSGLAYSKKLYDGYAVGNSATFTEAVINQNTEAFTASTTALGPPSSHLPNDLTVYVTRTDGKVFSKSFDVTSQILNMLEAKVVYIHIEGLKIPTQDITSDADVGIEVGVDGWKVEEILITT
ncbi:MAG: DUF5119 domain-containing protein [Prevotella sp.]|nr:DUF5119 domain-containing protein [Bacteroides sp.]MCM1367097.1 DUF5119 domain-containing protein [Prevotella sp.]MCM1437362.1 DUF5119 domain-containing protein [Prevotella sp.]